MTIVVVQSRLGSTRLHGKALLPLNEKPVLAHVLNAMKQVPADGYYLATDYSSEEKLKPIAQECGFECFAGPEDDVLKRFCMLIEKTGADVVLRATGDNPFLFVEAAVKTIEVFSEKNCDYFTFTGLPHGSGVEIFNAKSLLKAEVNTNLPYDREHVGPALYNHKDKFVSVFEKSPEEWYYPNLRTTIDTAADYRRAQFMAETLNLPATCTDIVKLAQKCAKPVLFVPSVTKGNGTGHLRRCIELAGQVYGDILIPHNADLPEIAGLIKTIPAYRIVTELPQKNEYALIVADTFMMDKNLAAGLLGLAPVVAIDEGSAYSDYADYLIDIIPSCEYTRKPNFKNSGFIPLPENRRKRPSSIQKVMVVFGGEDPAGFAVPFATMCAAINLDVTAVIANPEAQKPNPRITFVKPVANLKETLCDYDLVITHYGFTAFEAVAAGCAVLLAETTELHMKLAQTFGFATLSLDEMTEADLAKKLENVEKLFPSSKEMNDIYKRINNEKLSDFITSLLSLRRFDCPVCGEKKQADFSVARFANRTVRRCNSCGMLYLAASCEPEKTYSESYFFDEYKNQYGKTYLEDFDSIKAQGIRRSTIMDELYWKTNKGKKNESFPAVLDVGCAYGPFMAAAHESGWEVFGTDISENAADYVANTLEFPACASAFPDIDTKKEFGREKFEAVSMWYVIEHFSDLRPVLQKVSECLSPGGIFAFSTPSASGVSAKYNTENFFQNSPSDHYTLWEPEECGAILQKFGFKVLKIVSTGQHPERFPYYKNHPFKRKGLHYRFYSMLSRVCGLGDTFEVYCKKL